MSSCSTRLMDSMSPRCGRSGERVFSMDGRDTGFWFSEFAKQLPPDIIVTDKFMTGCWIADSEVRLMSFCDHIFGICCIGVRVSISKWLPRFVSDTFIGDIIRDIAASSGSLWSTLLSVVELCKHYNCDMIRFPRSLLVFWFHTCSAHEPCFRGIVSSASFYPGGPWYGNEAAVEASVDLFDGRVAPQYLSRRVMTVF